MNRREQRKRSNRFPLGCLRYLLFKIRTACSSPTWWPPRSSPATRSSARWKPEPRFFAGGTCVSSTATAKPCASSHLFSSLKRARVVLLPGNRASSHAEIPGFVNNFRKSSEPFHGRRVEYRITPVISRGGGLFVVHRHNSARRAGDLAVRLRAACRKQREEWFPIG